MEHEAGVAREPSQHLWLLVSGVVVEDDVNDVADRDLCLEALRKRMNS